MKRKHWLHLVGLLILARILWKLDWPLFLGNFRHMNPLWVGAAAALAFCFVSCKAMRWHSLLRIQGIRFSIRQSFHAYFVGIFFAVITPGRLGEVVKVFYLEHDAGVSHSRAFSGVLADRLFDMVALITLALGFMYADFLPPGFQLPCKILGWAFLLGMLPLLHRPTARSLYAAGEKLPLIGARLRKRESLMRDFYLSFEEFKHPAAIVPALWTVAAQALLFLHANCMARALHIQMTLLETAFFMVVANIVSLIPISIAGLGPREQTMKELFSRILDRGQPHTPELLARLGADAVSFSLSHYGIVLLTVGLAGYLAWLRNPIELASVQRLAEDIRSGKKAG